MRAFVIGVSAAVGALTVATPVEAQWGYGGSRYQRDLRQVQRECNRDLRRADTRREYIRARRECRRDLARLQRAYHRYSSRRYYDGGYYSYYDDGRRWRDDRWRDYDRRWDRRRDRDDDDDD